MITVVPAVGQVSSFVQRDESVTCPVCGRYAERQFSPTVALFVAEAHRAENVDAYRRYASRLERDPALQQRERRAREPACSLYERLRSEPVVSAEVLTSIVEAGRRK